MACCNFKINSPVLQYKKEIWRWKKMKIISIGAMTLLLARLINLIFFYSKYHSIASWSSLDQKIQAVKGDTVSQYFPRFWKSLTAHSFWCIREGLCHTTFWSKVKLTLFQAKFHFRNGNRKNQLHFFKSSFFPSSFSK